MNHFLKKADEYLAHDNHDLRAILEKIKLLAKLNCKIEGYLDPAIARFCQVANIVNGKLILIATNGSVATQIRYQTSDLLEKVRKDKALSNITSIECKVRPHNQHSSPRMNTQPVKNAPPLSSQTAQVVKAIAETIEDKKLREVMMRIAENV